MIKQTSENRSHTYVLPIITIKSFLIHQYKGSTDCCGTSLSQHRIANRELPENERDRGLLIFQIAHLLDAVSFPRNHGPTDLSTYATCYPLEGDFWQAKPVSMKWQCNYCAILRFCRFEGVRANRLRVVRGFCPFAGWITSSNADLSLFLHSWSIA
ncbi:hypothetical protein M426DRAFT_139241 [Hypoxylon sp. CI-4A]|nr:hypothetical protein M426DRAFT_139241 [Hypoxylon sp. CI-4A]